MCFSEFPESDINQQRRIVKARRMGTLYFEDLKKMGVVLKRALYFITCRGRMMYPVRMDEDYITRNLLNTHERLPDGADGMTFGSCLYLRIWD